MASSSLPGGQRSAAGSAGVAVACLSLQKRWHFSVFLFHSSDWSSSLMVWFVGALAEARAVKSLLRRLRPSSFAWCDPPLEKNAWPLFVLCDMESWTMKGWSDVCWRNQAGVGLSLRVSALPDVKKKSHISVGYQILFWFTVRSRLGIKHGCVHPCQGWGQCALGPLGSRLCSSALSANRSSGCLSPLSSFVTTQVCRVRLARWWPFVWSPLGCPSRGRPRVQVEVLPSALLGG